MPIEIDEDVREGVLAGTIRRRPARVYFMSEWPDTRLAPTFLCQTKSSFGDGKGVGGAGLMKVRGPTARRSSSNDRLHGRINHMHPEIEKEPLLFGKQVDETAGNSAGAKTRFGNLSS